MSGVVTVVSKEEYEKEFFVAEARIGIIPNGDLKLLRVGNYQEVEVAVASLRKEVNK